MLVKIPREIKIGADSYDIILKPNLKLREGCVGETKYMCHTITVDVGLMQDDKMNTFLHEVLHSIDHAYSCSLDESNIDRMAGGLTEFLRDNLGIEFDWSLIKEE